MLDSLPLPSGPVRLLLGVLLLPAALAASAWAQEPNGLKPGELRSYSTLHSIGFEWDITGDANHNASCPVQYRAQDAAAWKAGFPLMRIDCSGWYGERKADRPYNMVAGSILFLEPGTTYEVKLALADPDGGADERVVAVKTRAVPTMPTGGRNLHVVPGAGGGDGSQASPFKGLPAAQDAAQPGDVILVHQGDYGNADSRFQFQKSGTPGNYLVWKAAGDGDAVLIAGRVAGSHIWLEGLVFKTDNELILKADGKNPDGGNGLRADGTCEDVVVSRCRFHGYHYAILLSGASRAWYIADNVIVGDKLNIDISDISGEGIELNHTSGHDVCYNRIERVADGVSYCLRNCDIYGNDMRDLTDDGIEPDYGYANNRMWGNRILRPFNEAFSAQPMYCGPWYFVRNEVYTRKNMLKANVVDRFVFVNNTLVSDYEYVQGRAGAMLRSFSRNNLWILAPRARPEWKSNFIWAGGQLAKAKYQEAYSARPDWRTDVDYDGFDWGSAPQPFLWNLGNGRNAAFRDVASISEAIGILKHGIAVRRQEIFEIPDLRAYALEPYSARRLTLKAGSSAIDAGQPVPNIAETFLGKAPDLGAYECGAPLPHYGPRPAGAVAQAP